MQRALWVQKTFYRGWQVGVSQIWRHDRRGNKKVHCRIGRSLRDVRTSAANLSLGIVERIDAKKFRFLVALGPTGTTSWLWSQSRLPIPIMPEAGASTNIAPSSPAHTQQWVSMVCRASGEAMTNDVA